MKTIEKKINEANNLCVNRIMESYPVLVDIDQALEVIPKMESNMLIHGGLNALKGGMFDFLQQLTTVLQPRWQELYPPPCRHI